MSTRARHICYFFDYAALSMYSLGKGVRHSLKAASHRVSSTGWGGTGGTGQGAADGMFGNILLSFFPPLLSSCSVLPVRRVGLRRARGRAALQAHRLRLPHLLHLCHSPAGEARARTL
uniref:Uncharacterized protein n=1 Tax=Anas platyrhynchos platyrhynchos TaxID=8840 RepID=A0A493THE5_ANAPP